MGNEYMTHRFLQDKGTKDIPLVKEMHQFGSPGVPYQFTVMSRVKGISLEKAWLSLSPGEKKNYTHQVVAALREMRQFTSPVAQRVDGTPLPDHLIATCDLNQPCKPIGKNKEEWFNGMIEELRYGLSERLNIEDTEIIEAKVQELQNNFPDGAPYVLTHRDLHLGNILVKDGKIEAFIDWEYAGYYPWWVERYISSMRAVSNAQVELFDAVWAELEPDLSHEQFSRMARDGINPVISAWTNCPIEHTEDHDGWLRPIWCECKSYGGTIRKTDHGAELKHTIDYGYVITEARMDRIEEEGIRDMEASKI